MDVVVDIYFVFWFQMYRVGWEYYQCVVIDYHIMFVAWIDYVIIVLYSNHFQYRQLKTFVRCWHYFVTMLDRVNKPILSGYIPILTDLPFLSDISNPRQELYVFEYLQDLYVSGLVLVRCILMLHLFCGIFYVSNICSEISISTDHTKCTERYFIL